MTCGCIDFVHSYSWVCMVVCLDWEMVDTPTTLWVLQVYVDVSYRVATCFMYTMQEYIPPRQTWYSRVVHIDSWIMPSICNRLPTKRISCQTTCLIMITTQITHIPLLVVNNQIVPWSIWQKDSWKLQLCQQWHPCTWELVHCAQIIFNQHVNNAHMCIHNTSSNSGQYASFQPHPFQRRHRNSGTLTVNSQQQWVHELTCGKIHSKDQNPQPSNIVSTDRNVIGISATCLEMSFW